MLAQHGGRAYAALRPEGGSLHLLDWPTSIILAGVSPALCPPLRSRCGTPFPWCPPHPPQSPAPGLVPPPAAQLPGSPGPANRGWGSPATPRSSAERLEAPPGFELLPGMEGCWGRDPRSRRGHSRGAACPQWCGGRCGVPPVSCSAVPCLFSALSHRCAARIPGPMAQEAAGGSQGGGSGAEPPTTPCAPTPPPPA